MFRSQCPGKGGIKKSRRRAKPALAGLRHFLGGGVAGISWFFEDFPNQACTAASWAASLGVLFWLPAFVTSLGRRSEVLDCRRVRAGAMKLDCFYEVICRVN